VKAKAKVARPKPSTAAHWATNQDPFQQIFANPRHRFASPPAAWPAKGSQAGSFGATN
jgi:hypothetical protein